MADREHQNSERLDMRRTSAEPVAVTSEAVTGRNNRVKVTHHFPSKKKLNGTTIDLLDYLSIPSSWSCIWPESSNHACLISSTTFKHCQVETAVDATTMDAPEATGRLPLTCRGPGNVSYDCLGLSIMIGLRETILPGCHVSETMVLIGSSWIGV
ncbi:hypothetical protein IAQ61_011172 [Plenodomus lingam]|uniref:uncharacterized protein n=1 Tax=Leptosphaeria maculans TaxID=5022 RepID=UPI003319CB96|nr:hypothetical protein IAQ61_011172 [Plenodomus lingam]